jgi:hypothetical protein
MTKKPSKQKFYYKKIKVGKKHSLVIYKHLKTGLKKIAATSYNPSSTRGVKSEVMNTLLQLNKLAKSRVGKEKYYTWRVGEKGNFDIEEI